MCLPELSDDDSDKYEVCCGSMHSYMASVFFCIVDFWSMFSMFFLIAYFHYYDDPLTWSVIIPMSVIYISFILYPLGPIGLYTGRRSFITLYYYRIIIMLIFILVWLAINFNEQQTILDIILSILWFLMAFIYSVGLYVHQRTYSFFKTRLSHIFIVIRWIGYDDGDLIFAAKLRAQGLPVTAYNMMEYFASINLEHESVRQRNEETTSAKIRKKD